MLGILAPNAVPLRPLLTDAPRSLAALSRHHRDGWGLALMIDREWRIEKSTACAAECPVFERAADTKARVAIAHVRQRTVGPTSLANTHPFQRGRWVLAHNGTVDDLAFLTKRTSRDRRDEIRGDTDSERLFAYLMSAIDHAPSAVEGVRRATRELGGARDVGAVNFLLSDGVELFAYRLGRTLFSCSRNTSGARSASRDRMDAVTGRAWSERAPMVAIASEALTDEGWEEVPQKTLLHVTVGGAEDRGPLLRAEAA